MSNFQFVFCCCFLCFFCFEYIWNVHVHTTTLLEFVFENNLHKNCVKHVFFCLEFEKMLGQIFSATFTLKCIIHHHYFSYLLTTCWTVITLCSAFYIIFSCKIIQQYFFSVLLLFFCLLCIYAFVLSQS